MSVAPSKEAIQAIVNADHGDPFAVLGMHEGGPGGALVVRAFVPGADQLEVISTENGERVAELDKLHPEGFFAGSLGRRKKRFPYRLRASNSGGTWEFNDPYSFLTVLGEMDIYLLGEGKHRRAYERLGAHLIELGGVKGASFAVWAPNARRVAVIGDFNNWDGRRHPMRLRQGTGIWELFIPDVGEGDRYKYEIKGAQGNLLPLKTDPYAFATEMRPQTAGVIRKVDDYPWKDGEWLNNRIQHNNRRAPMAIYEVHLGSWKRGENNRFLTYRELADELVPYVWDMGFTHIELLPISEHPFDGSWGYQPIGLFAPTSRFGTPEDFAYFIERCHQVGVSVILDWVPAHFPTDPHGLGLFDGTAVYEHADPRQGFHRDWSTLIYNFGRNEVSNYLLSNALFWLDNYHIDGLRVDAVASMLYLDYSRREGEWIPNRFGGRENLEAIDVLHRMNEMVYADHEGAVTIAEESTAWPGVSRPVYLGGLGFGFKWNMGWMHDTLNYMSRDPLYRRYHHHEMTFGLAYAFSENFVLPLSHDEVVHGKRSILGRMPGDTWQQFANLRAYYGFMWTHPGKKLLFMGGEFGQGREWNHDASLDWHLLDAHWHAGVQRLVRDLNHLYRALPALHQLDCEPEGFAWVQPNDADNCVFAFARYGTPGTPPVVVACNLTPLPRYGYRLGAPEHGYYSEVLNTDAEIYGGSNLGNSGGVHSEDWAWNEYPHSICVTLPPLATVVLALNR